MSFNLIKFILLLTVSLFFKSSVAQKYWIVGGKNALQGELPWVADFRVYDFHYCGGALIHPQWVLTAAHCIEDSVAGKTIRLNSINTNGVLNPMGGEEIVIIEQYRHPLFDASRLNNGYDIGLLKLASPVKSISPIDVVPSTDTLSAYATGALVKVAGWGLETTSSTSGPDTMKWVTTKVYDLSLCAGGTLSSKMFCLGYKKGETPSGAGSGDSGGPAWRELIGGKKQLIGVVSGGELNATAADTPGYFTKIAYFRSWLSSIMKTTEIQNSILSEDKVIFSMNQEIILVRFGDIIKTDIKIELYDMNGKTIISETKSQQSNQTFTIDASPLSSGMYALKLSEPQGSFLVKKIFKY